MRIRTGCSVIFMLASLLSLIRPGVCQTGKREDRELRMSEQAILASIAVPRSPQGKKLCIQNELNCVGPDKGELGLALIGATHSRAARIALINLLGYRLDGSVAEDYSCYVFRNGQLIKKDLLAANPKSLSDRCRSELHLLVRGRKESFAGLDEDSVCADPASIKIKLKELIDGITKGSKCASGDF